MDERAGAPGSPARERLLERVTERVLGSMRERVATAARPFRETAERIDALLAEAAPFVESAARVSGEGGPAHSPSWREARSFAWLLAYRLGDQGWAAAIAASLVPAWRDAMGEPWAHDAADEVNALWVDGFARGREDRARAEAQRGLAEALPVAEIAPHIVLVVAAGALDSDSARALADRASAFLLRRDARAAVLDVAGLVSPSAAALAELWSLASAARMLGVRMAIAGVNGVVGEAIRTANLHDEGETRFATLAQAVESVQRAVGAPPTARGLAAWLRGLLGGRDRSEPR